MSVFKEIVRFLFALFAPLILIFAGAAVAVWGGSNDWQFVMWTGLVVAGAGIVWGLILFMFVDTW